MKLCFFDTETTGIDDNSKIIQIALGTNELSAGITSEFFGLPNGVKIEIGAMATHHITDKMIEGLKTFEDAGYTLTVDEISKDHVMVAHNAPFDVGKLINHGCNKPKFVIDTLKIARARLDQGRHDLQYLRYQFEIDVDAQAHDAKGDVMVLQGVFWKFFNEIKEEEGDEKKAISKMINISNNPVLLFKFPFGKHKGVDFREVPAGYLRWAQNNIDNMSDDLAYTIEQALVEKY